MPEFLKDVAEVNFPDFDRDFRDDGAVYVDRKGRASVICRVISALLFVLVLF
jgi:hypothetical protein